MTLHVAGWLPLVAAQVAITPSFDAELRFHEEMERSRWSANTMNYVAGASSAVLRHPYTIAHAPDGELWLNALARFRSH